MDQTAFLSKSTNVTRHHSDYLQVRNHRACFFLDKLLQTYNQDTRTSYSPQSHKSDTHSRNCYWRLCYFFDNCSSFGEQSDSNIFFEALKWNWIDEQSIRHIKASFGSHRLILSRIHGVSKKMFCFKDLGPTNHCPFYCSGLCGCCNCVLQYRWLNFFVSFLSLIFLFYE